MSIAQVIRAAIGRKQSVRCTYAGLDRMFSPHVLGKLKGEMACLAYQWDGESWSAEIEGKASSRNWRTFVLSKMEGVELIDGWRTAANYDGQPPGWDKIVARVPLNEPRSIIIDVERMPETMVSKPRPTFRLVYVGFDAADAESHSVTKIRKWANELAQEHDAEVVDVDMFNPERMTLAEWMAAAGQSIDDSNAGEFLAAWKRGEDPTEWRTR